MVAELLGGEVLSPRHWGEMKPPKVARHSTSGFLGCHVVLLEGIVPTGGELKASRLDRTGVPNLQDLMPDDLRCSNAIKIEIKCSGNVTCLNHPQAIPRPHPGPWKKIIFHKNNPWCQKRLGTAELEGRNPFRASSRAPQRPVVTDTRRIKKRCSSFWAVFGTTESSSTSYKTVTRWSSLPPCHL